MEFFGQINDQIKMSITEYDHLVLTLVSFLKNSFKKNIPNCIFKKSNWGREKGCNVGCVPLYASLQLRQYCVICIISLNSHEHTLRHVF